MEGVLPSAPAACLPRDNRVLRGMWSRSTRLSLVNILWPVACMLVACENRLWVHQEYSDSRSCEGGWKSWCPL